MLKDGPGLLVGLGWELSSDDRGASGADANVGKLLMGVERNIGAEACQLGIGCTAEPKDTA